MRVVLPETIEKHKRLAPRRFSEQHIAWLLAAPAVVLILLITVYPLLYSIWVVFVNYDIAIPGHDFVGLNNVRLVLYDPVARAALLHTIGLTVVVVILETLLGLILALCLHEPFKGRGLIMPLLIAPLFISPAIVGQFWALFLQRPFGPADYLLSQLLRKPVTISWLTDFPWNYFALIVADAWQWTPFTLVIILAGLTAIPDTLYEAAAIDGADSFRRFWGITLPLLSPSILIAAAFRFIDASKLFDIVYIMTRGGPGTSTYTVSLYLYQIGFQEFHISQATAGSWIFLIVVAIIANWIVRWLLREEATA